MEKWALFIACMEDCQGQKDPDHFQHLIASLLCESCCLCSRPNAQNAVAVCSSPPPNQTKCHKLRTIFSISFASLSVSV